MTSISKMSEYDNFVMMRLRTPKGSKLKAYPFQNYFYILSETLDEVRLFINRYVDRYEELTDSRGLKYVRILLNDNTKRHIVRTIIEEQGIKTFEADIPTTKRVLIDNNIDLKQNELKVIWYDIETFDLFNFEKDKMGNIMPVYPILSIAIKEKSPKNSEDEVIWYSHNKAFDDPKWDWYKSLRKQYLDDPKNQMLRNEIDGYNTMVIENLEYGERVLLEEFVEYVKSDYDVLSAFNGTNFDDPYIRERCKKYNIDFEKYMLVNMDYLEMFKKNNFEPRTSFGLNQLAKIELVGTKDKNKGEIEKLDWREITKAKKFFDLYLLYPEVLKEYNIQDTRLMDMIEHKFNYFNVHMVQSKIARCLLQDTMFNSRFCDYMILNEYKRRGIIAKSKPNKEEVTLREQEPTPPGGFVRANRGYYQNAKGYDFRSQYPTNGITYNISPETYIREVYPDLSKVFTDQEIEFIMYAKNVAKDFVDKNNKFQKKKYEDSIEKKRLELGVDVMETLMWKFITNYDNKIEHTEEECFTPTDINYDVRGWNIHPHYVFSTKQEGVYPFIWRTLLTKRMEIKQQMKGFDENTFEYSELDDFQLALKISANSLYGVLLFKGFRDYKYEIGTAITTSGRYHTKRAILKSQEYNFKSSHCDTDGVYLYDGDLSIEELNMAYYDFFKEMVKPFNTKCQIEMINPRTKEKEIVNHNIVFLYEKTLRELVVVARKRYYFIKEGSNEVKSMGGALKRSDTNPLGKLLQKDLLEDIFNYKYDKKWWVERLTNIKTKVENYELEEEFLINTSAISKPLGDYGKPIIDGETGLQKVTKSGKLRFANIPANVKTAKKMIAEGENVNTGDKISYIVFKDKPIEPLTISEFRKIKKYDKKYYYERIIKPVLEIMLVVYPQDVYGDFKKCWHYTERQIKKLEEKLLEEDLDES